MTDLATLAMDAHGGLDRWRELKSVSARLFQGGVLWKLKGQEDVLRDVHVAVDLRKEWASHRPFGQPDRHTTFQPGDRLQLAYFAGYAMWTYLNTPFLFALPGVETEEIQPWEEKGEAWRRLKVRFPAGIATHSAEQTFYFDQHGLLKRHDYDVDISGGTPAVHYVSELKEVSGIRVPTKHTIFGRQPDGNVAREPLVVSIDVSEVEFSESSG